MRSLISEKFSNIESVSGIVFVSLISETFSNITFSKGSSGRDSVFIPAFELGEYSRNLKCINRRAHQTEFSLDAKIGLLHLPSKFQKMPQHVARLVSWQKKTRGTCFSFPLKLTSMRRIGSSKFGVPLYLLKSEKVRR